MKKLLIGALLLFTSSAHAAIIEFVPPNDPVGRVFTTNSNDAWGSGRGVVFQATVDGVISSIGVYHDLTGIDLSYTLSQTTSANGNITTGETILASGSAVVTTNGLEWIDFPVADIPYTAGSFYHIEFAFSGNGNQNFFYDNNNVTFSQDGFDVIDGTQSGNTGNSVMPAIRLDNDASPSPAGPSVPIPALSSWGIALSLLLFGFFGYVATQRGGLNRK